MDPQEGLPERRRWPRRAVHVEVELDVFDEDRVIACVSEDLSVGGARVRAAEGVREAETVLVTLSAAGQTVVTLGEVLASTADLDHGVMEMRLQFQNLSPSRRNRLAHLLESA